MVAVDCCKLHTVVLCKQPFVLQILHFFSAIWLGAWIHAHFVHAMTAFLHKPVNKNAKTVSMSLRMRSGAGLKEVKWISNVSRTFKMCNYIRPFKSFT